MTDLTNACSALPRTMSRARPEPPTAERAGLGATTSRLSRLLLWVWLHWRRREIVQVLRRVDARLLRDAGIEPCDIEAVADALIARWR